MSGTVLLPVRGRRRIEVITLLVGSGVVTGALTGGLVGLVLGWLPEPGAPVIALVCLVAALLDTSTSRSDRLAPPSLRRQVPLAWGRIFSAPVAAILYGARLGVGPLTVLNSWTWWAAAILAGLHGPAVGAVAGSTFHLARVLVMLVATTGEAGPERMRQLDRLEAPSVVLAVAVSLGLGLGAVL